jgi:hypothetical protein
LLVLAPGQPVNVRGALSTCVTRLRRMLRQGPAVHRRRVRLAGAGRGARGDELRRLHLAILRDEPAAEEPESRVPATRRPHQLPHDNARDAAQVRPLAELCDRLPLAIIAERAQRADTLGEVAEALSDEVADLTGFDADLPAALSWSYRSLDQEAAAMFRLLGVHPAAGVRRRGRGDRVVRAGARLPAFGHPVGRHAADAPNR